MPHNHLWAPWRMEYIKSVPPEPESAGGCFLCDAAAAPLDSDNARARHVLLHDQRGIILLNRYPYTNGHLMVAPADHLGDLTDLSPTQRTDLIELVTLAERLLRDALNPQGINIGINLGRAAGAGLPGHLHFHVVPRWSGDTNFMDVVGHVRVVPQALEESYATLRAVLGKLK